LNLPGADEEPKTIPHGARGTLAWPRLAQAQQAERSYRVGWLSSSPRAEPYNMAFEQRLRELGFVEGRNLVIEFRTAQGRVEKLPELAADLARHNCDVLLVPETEAHHVAIKQATRDTPVVIVAIDYDPVATGHITSLVRPGGRITGMTHIQSELPAKRVELLKELLPSARKVAGPCRFLQHRPTRGRRGQRKAPGRGAPGAGVQTRTI
jgi:putative tryptophan/tyrosine transport system substrate-binding protein